MITLKKVSAVSLACCFFLFWGCAPATREAGTTRTAARALSPKAADRERAKEKKLVAVVGFENKSTYASDKLWDTSSQLLATNLIEMGYFKVVEWERMKQLFDWDALSTSSLVKTPERRNEVRKILLCEYFISGAVTFFDVSQKAEVSALSKKKRIETTIRVDLMLQESQTGEFVAAAKGEHTETQTYEGGMLGGGIGTWDPKAADRALNEAIRNALTRLTEVYERDKS